jgi:NAD(P)-dependent dehydrogenase (short-subunit alcohol dehydrogenase family)
MDLQLNDKSALVSGSTAGIGLEIARKLAIENAKVIVAGRNQARLNQAVESIRAAGGVDIRGVLTDPSTVEGATALMQAAP